MARIIFPPSVNISGFNIGLDTDEDITHISLSGFVEILTRTPGRWRGSLAIPQSDDAQVIRSINRWIVDMSNAANYSHVPIQGFDTFDASDAPEIASGPALVGGRLQYQLAGSYNSLQEGHFVLIDDRLFMVSVLSGADVVFMPEVQGLTAGRRVVRADSFRVIKDPEADFISLPSSPDFSGPWSFAFTERRS